MEPETINYIITIATAATTLIAAISAGISYILFRTATDPDVVVYTDQDPSEPRFLFLVIENIGKGMAYNTHFKLSGELYQITNSVVDRKKPLTNTAFTKGISMLPPNGKRVFLWGHHQSVIEHLNGKRIKCEITFSGKHYLLGNRTEFTNECIIDADSYNSIFDRTFDKQRNLERQFDSLNQTLKDMESKMPNSRRRS